MSDKTGRPADTRSVVNAVHFTPTPFPAGATVGTSVVVDGVEWIRGADGNWHSSIRGLVAAEEGTAEDFAAALDTIDRLTRELEAARAENSRMREDAARWPDTESLALQVLDEVEAAIAAGRAMGHGAYAIVHRLRRLLTPSRRADGGAGGA